MPYVTPVTDRTAADIAARNSKAFLNVADWVRIYDNSLFVRNLVQTSLGISIQFDTVATPTITTIPTVTNLNTMLANIERLRLAVALGTEIKDDWEAGPGKEAPSYIHVNQWEQTLDLIHTAYTVGMSRYPRTGIGATGRDLTQNNSWR